MLEYIADSARSPIRLIGLQYLQKVRTKIFAFCQRRCRFHRILRLRFIAEVGRVKRNEKFKSEADEAANFVLAIFGVKIR